jgi:thiol-disulfide isomerase/thioredoxin
MAEVRRRGARLVGAAAAAGLAAGVAAVYVIGWPAGNAAAGACALAPERAGALAPHVRGEVAAFLLAEEPVDVSALAFEDADGQPVTLADFRGRTVLLNLWATWCVPCRAEMPALDRLQAANGDEDFEVVAVNVDLGGRERPDIFLEEENIDALRRFYDPTMATFQSLREEALAFGMPTTLLVDVEGCQIGALHGAAEWDSGDAKALIEAAEGI